MGWLIVFAAASLGACQGLPQQAPWGNTSTPQVPSWRVVERLGEARYLGSSMSGWEEVVAGSMLPAGSQVSTGIGGRLIITQASHQLSAGTNSRFILPGWEPGGSVRQTAGWLRYRIAGSQSGSFGIETPFLDLAVDDAVLDVTVADSETEVAVVSGRVHVKTLDDRRQIDLHAGYIGYAGLQGGPLALRRGPGLALEPVPVTVIPALAPGRPGHGTAAAAADPAAIEGTPAGMPGGPAHVTAEAATDMVSPLPAAIEGTPAGIPGGPARVTAVAATDMVSRRDARPAPGWPTPSPPDVVRMPAMVQLPATTQRSAIAPSTVPPRADRAAKAAPAPDVLAGPATARAVAPARSVLPAAMPKAVAAPVPLEDAGPGPTPAATPGPLARNSAGPNLETSLVRADLAGPRSAPQPGAPVLEPAEPRFDLLTEGLLDGLSPAPPAMQGDGR